MKVKVFTVTHANEMESAINRWLAMNPSIEVQHVRQSESMNKESWSMTLSIFFTDHEKVKLGFETAASKLPPMTQNP